MFIHNIGSVLDMNVARLLANVRSQLNGTDHHTMAVTQFLVFIIPGAIVRLERCILHCFLHIPLSHSLIFIYVPKYTLGSCIHATLSKRNYGAGIRSTYKKNCNYESITLGREFSTLIDVVLNNLDSLVVKAVAL